MPPFPVVEDRYVVKGFRLEVGRCGSANAMPPLVRAVRGDDRRDGVHRVHRIARYEWLERCGFEGLRVNARPVKNVSGRKSDVRDDPWLQQWLSFELLHEAFRPADPTYARAAARPGPVCAAHAKGDDADEPATGQRHQRRGWRDGQKIVRALVTGEHDPKGLASDRDCRIKASEQGIAASLLGICLVVCSLAPCRSTRSRRFLHKLSVCIGSPPS